MLITENVKYRKEYEAIHGRTELVYEQGRYNIYKVGIVNLIIASLSNMTDVEKFYKSLIRI